MSPMRVRYFWQYRSPLAASLLLCFSIFGPVPAAFAQTDSVDEQINLLKDQRTYIRNGAVQKLAELKDPRAIEPLIAALKDWDSGVQWGAEDALAKTGAPAVEPLIAAMKDQNYQVRKFAAIALGEIRDSRSFEPFLAALSDRDSEVRGWAAVGLGKSREPRAFDPLMAIMEDSKNDLDLRGHAASGLSALGDPRAIAPLIDALGYPYAIRQDSVEGALQGFGQAAIDPLIAALKSPNGKFRGEVTRVLLKILPEKDPRAVNALLLLVQPPSEGSDTWLIAEHYKFFLKRGAPGSEPALINALNLSGNVVMAQDFLACGNPKLRMAARDWAKVHGYKVEAIGGYQPSIRWGSKQ
ncbi:MAG: HEAT repeat domain-containing protein [Terracidiphilus sp.]